MNIIKVKLQDLDSGATHLLDLDYFDLSREKRIEVSTDKSVDEVREDLERLHGFYIDKDLEDDLSQNEIWREAIGDYPEAFQKELRDFAESCDYFATRVSSGDVWAF